MRLITTLLLVFASSLATAAEPVAWRTEYNAARKEASEANLPVCLVIGSENCVYCRKMEASTLQDANVTAQLRQQYVAVKLDGNKEVDLVRALRVQVYPTTVLAGPDGAIHAIINGYVSPEQFQEHLKRTLVVVAEDDRQAKDLASATAAITKGDQPAAGRLLRQIVADFRERPAQVKARAMLEQLDRAAQQQAVVKAVRPQALFEIAKQLHDSGRFADALDVCDEVSRSHPNTPEAKAAAQLVASVTRDGEKLRAASLQADEKAANLQLALATNLQARGQVAAATACLEQVVRLCPTGPKADAAKVQLAKLSGGRVPAITAGLKKGE